MAESALDLPDPGARELYRAILRGGGRLRPEEVRAEDEPAFRQLVALGLLDLRIADHSYSTVNPRVVSERLGADLRERSAELLVRAALVPDLLDDLAQAYDAAPRRAEPVGGVQRVSGTGEIRHLLSQFARDYPHEVLTAQPGKVHPPAHRADSLAQTRRYLAGGGSIRTLYEPQARLTQEHIEFAVEATKVGSRIRILNAPFTRALIFDRTVAVIPAAPDNSAAAVIEEPVMVAYMVDVFEQQWRRAQTVDWEALTAGPAAPVVHEQVGRLLAQGLTQRSIASRLGLSERTVAGHIARLRELYDAETLFQLGWQMQGTDRDRAS
ncbi:LuxR C-terminal-related transcriptional regulator [Streptomyces sp. NRRL WC-3742]|uniref:LuxR C-terminal-related transcriptional regulator n=1 Tax=Streptomyces sp. NRRL WC-3742 TaxID=1463934 RepID=UPI0004CB5B56|nr:LuxR C-terminal-related transcriptional regulator [Streptomyces sp. NRRL WC-3742]